MSKPSSPKLARSFSGAGAVPELVSKTVSPRVSYVTNNGDNVKNGKADSAFDPRVSIPSLFGFVGGSNTGLSRSSSTAAYGGGTPRASHADTLEGDAWDMLKRKSFLNREGFGGAPLIGPNSSRRRSSKRQSMMKRNILAIQESFMPPWQRMIIEAIDGTVGTIFMAVVTIWALFGDDIRLIAFHEEQDEGFVYVVYFCLVVFALELILASVAKKGYLNGFYFWLDAVATLSLLMDIPPFMESIGLSHCTIDNYGAILAESDHSEDGGAANGGAVTDGAFARAGRASRAGTRAGRIVRIVRLVRVVKLYKAWQMKRDAARAKKNNLLRDEDEDEDDNGSTQETRVGQRLSDLTTRRVIIGVLTMLFCLPLFDINTFPAGDEALLTEGGLKMVHNMLVLNGQASRGFYSAVDNYEHNTDGMYVLVINGTRFEDHDNVTFSLDGYGHRSLRCEEFQFTAYISPPEHGEDLCKAQVDPTIPHQ